MNIFNSYNLSFQEWEELVEDVVRGLVAVAVFCYVAGETLGKWVHHTNDQFTTLWVAMLVGEETATAVEVELKLPPVRNAVTPLLPAGDQPVALLPPVKVVVISSRHKRGKKYRLSDLADICT